MVPYRRVEIVSGVFILVAVATFALFAFEIGDLDDLPVFRKRAVTCIAKFTDVKGIAPGAKVTVGGIRVGRVTGMRFVAQDLSVEDTNRLAEVLGTEEARRLGLTVVRQVVEVSFELQDPDLRLHPPSARVELMQDGLLGEHHLALHPGYWSPDSPPVPLFESTFEQPLSIASDNPTSIEQVFTDAHAVVTKANGILARVSEALGSADGENRLERIVLDFEGVVRGVRRLLDVDNPKGVYGSVLSPLRNLIAGAESSLHQVSGRLLRETLPRGERVLDEAESLLVETRPQLRQILRDSGAAAKTIASILDENRASIAESTRRLRRALWEVEMAVRKIRANPAVLLFGDDERELAEMPSDLTDARRAGRARPYRQRDEAHGKK